MMRSRPLFVFIVFIVFIVFTFCGWTLRAQTITLSELPIVIIETNGQSIPDEPKITASMKIIWNGPGQINHITDPANEYDGQIGIEIRGSSSAWYPQTPYAIETRDADGVDQNVPLFGFPPEHDWCLLSHYNEKTFARFALGFEMFREMGHWAPRCQLVEVLLNGEYRGIFLFCEKIKRDDNRVDIKKAEPTATAGSDELSGGYIFKVDYWDDGNSFPAAVEVPGFPGFVPHFVYYYPKPEDLSTLQRDYLRNFINEFESVLYGPDYTDPDFGYTKYIDVNSFIDYFIVSEVSRNNDGYKKSRYFSKNRDSEDGRIHAGPVWDFDWAWKDIDECAIIANTDGSGWSYTVNTCPPDVISPGWYDRLLQDTAFAQAVCTRYVSLRQDILSNSRLLDKVDSIAFLVQTSKTRHYNRWPILSENGWAPEVNFTPTTYTGEVNRLKSWIIRRMAWLDQQIPQWCPTVKTEDPLVQTPVLWPNPAGNTVSLQGIPADMNIRCFDITGKAVLLPGHYIDQDRWVFDTQQLPNGTYILRFQGNQPMESVRLEIVR